MLAASLTPAILRVASLHTHTHIHTHSHTRGHYACPRSHPQNSTADGRLQKSGDVVLVCFGKHAGETLGAVIRKDRSYIDEYILRRVRGFSERVVPNPAAGTCNTLLGLSKMY